MRCPLETTGDKTILLDYCSGALSNSSVAALELHTVKCSQCTDWIAGQRQIWTALDEWKATPPSTGFDRRLYARIDQYERSRWSRRLWPAKFGWKPAMPFAGACVAVIAAFMVSTPARPPVVPLPESSRIEMLEPEQVERTLEDLEMLKQLSAAPGSQSL